MDFNAKAFRENINRGDEQVYDFLRRFTGDNSSLFP
jgi:hypothetical protein